MTVQALKALLTRRPFEPFRVVTTRGNRHDVGHPDMAWLTQTTLYVGAGETPDGIPAEARLVPIAQIASAGPILLEPDA